MSIVSERDGSRIVVLVVTTWYLYECENGTLAIKTLTIGWKTNYDAELNTSDIKKLKNSRKQNFEDKSNNMQLD